VTVAWVAVSAPHSQVSEARMYTVSASLPCNGTSNSNPGGPLDQGGDRAAPALADDQLTLPVCGNSVEATSAGRSSRWTGSLIPRSIVEQAVAEGLPSMTVMPVVSDRRTGERVSDLRA
jgi:hypothetical protein